MMTCTQCGHPDYVHCQFAGECLHENLKPIDGSTCDCKEMR